MGDGIMPKRPSLKSRVRGGVRYYYCEINGRQFGLGTDQTIAASEFARILRGDDPEPADGVTIGDLVVAFAKWSASHSSGRTAEDYYYWLRAFAKHVGTNTPAMSVRPKHVDRFVRSRELVGQWGHIKIVRSVRRLYRWAKRQGELEFVESPVAGLDMPPAPDSPQAILSPRQAAYLVRTARNDFRDVLRWYYHTGCRPEELLGLRKEWVDAEQGTVTIPWKLAKFGKRTRKDRVIVFPAKLDRMVRRRLEDRENETEWLFVRGNGEQWTRWSIDSRLERKMKVAGRKFFPDGLYVRLFRYTFTTTAIKRGVDIVTLSHLLGHKDVTMLRRHYEKLGGDFAHLRDAVNRAAGGASGGGPGAGALRSVGGSLGGLPARASRVRKK